MKNMFKNLLLILLSIILFNCSSDDDNNVAQNPLLGKWEAVSGSLIDGFLPDYIIFNNDNSVNILLERGLGFKNNFKTDYNVSGSDVVINLQGNYSYQYTLDEETLTLTYDSSNTAIFTKNNAAPNANEWIQELSVLSQGDAPWDGTVDIAFTYDKTKILYGMNNSATYIPLIDPETFVEVGQITSSSEARVVEVEKYPDPIRYLFKSDGDSDLISYYYMDANIGAGAIELAAEVSGLASVDDQKIWISNNDNNNLYLFNYEADTIEEQFNIGISTYGLDYQSGYLFVSDGQNLHKCQTSPDFQVVESYSIQDVEIQGIAFDGINFWLSGYNNAENSYQLIKTNLTL